MVWPAEGDPPDDDVDGLPDVEATADWAVAPGSVATVETSVPPVSPAETGSAAVDGTPQPWLAAVRRATSDICSSSASRAGLTRMIRATAPALRAGPLSPARSESRRCDCGVSELRQPWLLLTAARRRWSSWRDSRWAFTEAGEPARRAPWTTDEFPAA